ncbi:related to DAL5-Allantoate and ureidosuccinate permease [Fusarium fujikuroi IMI 58289]|uniref:Related to DAL5-Allantoate and ureidosuccinate permease n=1 Tax=Gibberella fujikuroi (strain CBS 195.34 / IMI 58289 / NRRL A-6831) TaxID=1279085 RepID=S0DS01_GIBF5|nr:related to DAL5-Allantoate and ureidosuccinate permease [Fusarium fujikuroi IMI 58289]KLO94485.1 DAL5-Allantoate and ureidosuccinate permease [Fusarium fujikuroi]CCT65215.1 related to DAL5-Allantoate and ureidosuccinate permease [Fusarium fujikuroi IMI 58289]SCO35241.1 related to DAL5-Allantoate and ureidosuccinate permease [Fusarium fujikuroi]
MDLKEGHNLSGPNKAAIELATMDASASVGETNSTFIMTPAEERKLVRKIDLHLMPLMFVLYLLQYLDKTSLGYTAIMGIIQDAASQPIPISIRNLNANNNVAEPQWYPILLDFELLLRGISRSQSSIFNSLGEILSIQMVMAAGKSFASLAVLRILLGAFEAAISPGFTIITSTWYKPSEHALRHGLWYCGASVAYIIGGIIAYGISHINSAIKAWQFLFIIFGAVTFIWGLVVWWLLPTNPQSAWFLNEHERKLAFERVQGARHSVETGEWNYAQMREAFMDPRSWLFFLICVFSTIPGGGMTAFGSIIIKDFGYSVLQTQLLSMSVGAFLLFFVIMTVAISMTLKNSRCLSISLLNFISLAGVLMVKLLPESNKTGRLGGLWLVCAHASAFPTILSLVSSNITGHTKKATVNGMLFIGFCTGYIIGSLTFIAQEAPAYKTAFNIMVACFVLNIAIIISMRQIMAKWNNQRNQEYGPKPVSDGLILEHGRQVDLDETDWENKDIRYFDFSERTLKLLCIGIEDVLIPAHQTRGTSSLDGKTAIVTGGSRGIGQAISINLARKGLSKLAITYSSNIKAAEETLKICQELGVKQAVAIQADALDPEFGPKTVAQALERLDTTVINILVNNAVLADHTKVLSIKDTTLNIFLEIMQANVYAPVSLTTSLLPHLPEYGGRVINISSVLAYQGNADPTVAYGASKTALQSYTRSFAENFSKYKNATFNSVVVGLTATDSIKASQHMMPPGFLDGQIRDTTAGNRIGVPDDIVYVVGFLAGEEGRWVNGAAVSANGGNRLLIPVLG